jgi:redox-regulated HSP33 family molecular chaperone
MSERTANRIVTRTDAHSSSAPSECAMEAMLTSEILATDTPKEDAVSISTGSVTIGALTTIIVSLHTHKPLRSYYVQTNDLFAALDSCISSSIAPSAIDDKWTHKLIIHNARDSSRNLRIVWSE